MVAKTEKKTFKTPITKFLIGEKKLIKMQEKNTSDRL
jgi:hypothetical protein